MEGHGPGQRASVMLSAAWRLSLVAGLAFAFTAAPAHAATSKGCAKYAYIVDGSGRPTYQCVRYSPGSAGNVHHATSCNLVPPATFCMGADLCWYSEWSGLWVEPRAVKPSGEGVTKAVRHCLNSGTVPVWRTNPPVRLTAAMAAQAVGRLPLPKGLVAFTPPGSTVIGIPTTFWANKVPRGELQGSKAFRLVAIATPRNITTDFGDGTRSSCGWVTAPSTCGHTYQKRGVFQATMQAVWTLKFEDGGRHVDIPGAPTQVTSDPPWTARVPVESEQGLSLE